MPVTNGYCSRTELKSYIGVDAADTLDDFEADSAINAASRAIDQHCGRRFWKDTSTVTRTFTASWGDFLRVPDLVSITTLKTDDNGDRTYETTWASTDYDTEPESGIVAGVTGYPVTGIRARNDSASGSRTFPTTPRGVEIVGIWGWNAVPAAILQACLLEASRLLKRKDAPFGVAGQAELGQIVVPRLDPDVRKLLTPFVLPTVTAV